MRNAICFVVALGLLAGGVTLLFLLPERRLLLLAGAGCATAGAAWLWADFVGPMFGRSETGDMLMPDVPPDGLVQSAEAGDAEAQSALGRWYAEHRAEMEKAAVWFRRAADQGLPRGQHNMGVLALRANQIDEARDWFDKAVESGWVPSMFALGTLLEEDGNLPGATELYRMAANEGDADAQDALGRLAFDEDTQASHERALHWSGKAAAQGNAASQTRLGTIYHEGLGVERDPEQAAAWFLKAAEQGHPGAQFMIGAACHLGIGVRKDRVAAARWLSLSGTQGNELARAYLPQVIAELTSAEKRRVKRMLSSGSPAWRASSS